MTSWYRGLALLAAVGTLVAPGLGNLSPAATAATGGATTATAGGMRTTVATPAATATTSASATAADGAFTDGRYIVELAQDPSTLARASRSTTSASARRGYRLRGQALERVQDAVAASVGAVADAQYTAVLNGFAASLTADQARRLSDSPLVRSVAAERVFEQDAVTNEPSATADAPRAGSGTADRSSGAALTPAAVPTQASSPTWSATSPTASSAPSPGSSPAAAPTAGAGVVVGMLDSGFTPENPTVAGEPLASGGGDPTVPHLAADGSVQLLKADGGTFVGTCQTGDSFTADACSTKVVGARYFDAGPRSGTMFVPDGAEYVSPRDYDGHGSHTTAIAVGNADVVAQYSALDPTTISGTAPGAAVAVYKVCWHDSLFGSSRCAESDLIAGIEAAVTDGVDIISYSIGSSEGDDSVAGPVDTALLNAATAGVLVSASAGNSGPDAGTVDHTEPWITTVAASTGSAPRQATVVVAGAQYPGVSATVLGTSVADLPLVQDTANPGSRYCRAGSLDESTVRGSVVLCLRSSSADSTSARLALSAEVQRAGGRAMVLANTAASAQNLPLDGHSVPTAHVTAATGSTLAAAAASGATVSLVPDGSAGTVLVPAPQVASFSSRGPASTSYGNVLKPDLAAPGTTVLSAAPAATGTPAQFRFASGTSMSAPYVSGLAARYLAEHPEASPAAVRSALMTTTGPMVVADGTTSTDRFATGAGQVRPDALLDPGFVYDTDPQDWYGYLNGLGVDTGTRAAPVHGSDLNQPSLAIGQLDRPRTVVRTVTATDPGSYDVSVTLPGYDVTVAPSTLVLARTGQQVDISVTVARTSAPLDEYVSGELVWRSTDGTGRTSRFPVAVRAVSVSTEPPLAELPALPEPEPEPEPAPGDGEDPDASEDTHPGDRTPRAGSPEDDLSTHREAPGGRTGSDGRAANRDAEHSALAASGLGAAAWSVMPSIALLLLSAGTAAVLRTSRQTAGRRTCGGNRETTHPPAT